MLNVKDLITLDGDKQYCVTSKTVFEGSTYYFLLDFNNPTNYKVCCERVDNGTIKLTQIEDNDLLKKLMVSFNKSNN